VARVHAVGALAVAVLYLFIFRHDGAPWLWVSLWTVGFALTAAAPFRPEFGLAAYSVVLYATPRYSELFNILARSNLLHFTVLFAGSGAVLWRVRMGRVSVAHSPLLTLALALFAWGGISALVPRPDVAQATLGLRHSTVFFVHALALLVVASQVMGRVGAARNFVLTLCTGLAVRVFWQGIDGVKLEGDIGPLAAMVLPLALVFAQTDPIRSVRVFMLASVAGAVITIALTYNRGAAVALAVVMALVGWRNRRNPWVVGSVVAGVGIAALWLVTTPYWTRFQEVWKELAGSSTGSVTERLELWKAGLRIVADHPVFGIGVGNYPAELAKYAPDLQGMVAHNSYVQVAAETGLPGLALYLALFITALMVTQRIVGGSPTSRPGAVAGAVQISIAACLSAGFFISRHDMVLAYLLVGWAAALSVPISRGQQA